MTTWIPLFLPFKTLFEVIVASFLEFLFRPVLVELPVDRQYPDFFEVMEI
jgi:hypothetical protein